MLKRYEANQLRWYKQLASQIDKIAIENKWKHIYLVGERELINEFEKQLAFNHITIRVCSKQPCLARHREK